MAKRGSTKKYSVEQEDYYAFLYNGKRSRSSGAADNDQGDVRSERLLIECKMTGRPGHKEPRLPVFVQEFAKVADEAYSEGREPMLGLRYYAPGHALANREGWIDLVVQLAESHAEREEVYLNCLAKHNR